MPRFFTNTPVGDRVALTGEDARHLSLSLRAKVGESVTLSDGEGNDFFCEIQSIAPEQVILSVLNKERSKGETAVPITLFWGLAKGEKNELIVQKSVELGVVRLVPFLSERCIARQTPADFVKKQQRYQKVALEAAKQSGRGRVPEVSGLMHFSALCREMAAFDCPLLCYERENRPLRDISLVSATSVAVIVGPEGGFSLEEAAALVQAGAQSVSLGCRIVRCETAPLLAVSACLYALGEL